MKGNKIKRVKNCLIFLYLFEDSSSEMIKEEIEGDLDREEA
jgi:hypothetical protein